MGSNNNGLTMLLLGLGALYLFTRDSKAPIVVGNGVVPPSWRYPESWYGVTMPSQAPFYTYEFENGGEVPRPPPEERLIIKTIRGEKRHVGYTEPEMAWRRAQPARAIRRGGGAKRR